jgi:hypothetical protein
MGLCRSLGRGFGGGLGRAAWLGWIGRGFGRGWGWRVSEGLSAFI